MSAIVSVKSIVSVASALLLVFVLACGGTAPAEPQPQAPAAPQAQAQPAAATAAPAAQTAPTAMPNEEPTATPFATAVPTVPPKVQAETPPRLMLKAPEANPKRGGVMQWAGLSDSPHFDMHQCNTAACAQPQGVYFDNLLRYSPFDGGVEVIPDLAYAWEVSDDGLVYTFHLREGVMFHDGAELTSEDVKATFDRIIFPPVGMISPRQSVFLAVEEVRTVDPLTVEFVLEAPPGLHARCHCQRLERHRTQEDPG